MKRLVCLIISVYMLTVVDAQSVKQNGKLKVQGTQLVNAKGESIVLHGMSFGWHNWWPRFYTAGTVKWLHDDWKCSVVRAAMGVEPDRGYIKDSAGSVRKIKIVVDAAIKEDIYVIIDWNSHNINLEEAKIFFGNMATAYHSYPNIIY